MDSISHTLSGWLFDVYLYDHRMNVWVITDDGTAHHLVDRLEPSFFVYGTEQELHTVCEWIQNAALPPVQFARAERYELAARQTLTVLEVRVLQAVDYSRVVHRLTQTFPHLDFYNADLDLSHLYMIERDVFPFARVHVVVGTQDQIVEIKALDSRWDLRYNLPPLRALVLRVQGTNRNPKHGHRGPIEIEYNGTTCVLAEGKALVEQVRDILQHYDPDVLLTERGDSYILPRLLALAAEHQIVLPLNRDPALPPQQRPARSYFSYNRMHFRDDTVALFGRLHLDVKNAYLERDLVGMVEVARLSQRRLQEVARTSTGTANSAMQVAEAYRSGYLIPWRKSEPETWKTLREFVKADQGGLTYRPRAGLYWDVGELDFSAMYLAIMEKFNLSFETMHCSCCPDSRVPQIGYTVCQKRRGLIPQMLRRVLQKRLALKKAKKQAQTDAERDWYQCLIDAIKAILVTAFGYLGYKNAKFGRIEAHEATTAYGRFVLLTAKAIAERAGFQVLHALTDSLWLYKRGATEAEYQALADEIEQETELPISLEGVYTWIAFLPSRVHTGRSVPNRYFGWLKKGKVKVRGIELRRRDTPEWIKAVQQDLLHLLRRVTVSEDISDVLPDVFTLITHELERLHSGGVPPCDLVLSFHLSRDPATMKSNTLNAIVARELMGQGATLRPGESIEYILLDHDAPEPSQRARAWEFYAEEEGYDVERYTELLLRAAETILTPFGITKKMLHCWRNRALSVQQIQDQICQKSMFTEWGPLFANVQ